jgi:hypothetical protein
MSTHIAETRAPRSLISVAVVIGTLLSMLMWSPRAEASAYPIGVYSPSRVNSWQIQGWANLSRDCGGTVGCFNYIKIERRRLWGNEYVAGWWANNHGWNSVTATLPGGCYDYRTTTDSYNDIAGGYGSGINVGPVGWTSNGTRIYRFRITWSSGWARHCR